MSFQHSRANSHRMHDKVVGEWWFYATVHETLVETANIVLVWSSEKAGFFHNSYFHILTL